MGAWSEVRPAEMPLADRTERRSKPRIVGAFSAVIRVRGGGRPGFEEETTVDNFSANGFHFPLRAHVHPGTRLFALVHLPSAAGPEAARLPIAILGTVVRVEQQLNAPQDVAVHFDRYRFL